MLVYISAFTISLIFAWMYDHSKISNMPKNSNILARKMCFLFSVLPIIIISGIRYGVGIDYINIYRNGFIATGYGESRIPGSSIDMEIGIQILNKVIHCFSKDPLWFFVVTSIIIYVCIFYFIRQTNDRLRIGILLFFITGLYFSSLNIVRQYVVMALGMLGYKYIEERKISLYIVLCTVLMSIHLSAVILSPRKLKFLFPAQIRQIKISGFKYYL